MRKLFVLLTVLVAVAASTASAQAPAPAAPAAAPAAPAAQSCTNWLPPQSVCYPQGSFATVYNDLDPWYMSNSYARRTEVGFGPSFCLPSNMRVRVRYYRQDGSIMWDSGPTPYGSCGQIWAANSGQTYVKVALNLHYSGCTGCPGSHSYQLISWSKWS